MFFGSPSSSNCSMSIFPIRSTSNSTATRRPGQQYRGIWRWMMRFLLLLLFERVVTCRFVKSQRMSPPVDLLTMSAAVSFATWWAILLTCWVVRPGILIHILKYHWLISYLFIKIRNKYRFKKDHWGALGNEYATGAGVWGSLLYKRVGIHFNGRTVESQPNGQTTAIRAVRKRVRWSILRGSRPDIPM